MVKRIQSSFLVVVILIAGFVIDLTAAQTYASTALAAVTEETTRVPAETPSVIYQPTPTLAHSPVEESPCHASFNWAEPAPGTNADPVVQRRLATLDKICSASLNWAVYGAYTDMTFP
jgi:hypothetical protein